MTSSKETRLTRWFGRRPLRTVLRLGAIALGMGATGWLLSVLWPEPDRAAKEASAKSDALSSLAPFPASPVTVLVVGIDANQLGEPLNQAAPLGRANADALLLLRVSADEPLQVLQIPSEIAVQLPGSNTPTSYVRENERFCRACARYCVCAGQLARTCRCLREEVRR